MKIRKFKKEDAKKVSYLICKTKRELERNPKLASKLIPSTIEIANGKEVTA